MRVTSLARLALLSTVAGLACAEERIVNVRVYTEPSGARFRVDGQDYYSAQSFLWPVGSKHIVSFDMEGDGYQYSAGRDTRWQFSGWTESTGKLSAPAVTTQVITADASITFYKANLAPEYRVRMDLYSAPSGSAPPPVSPPGCGAPGALPPNEIRSGVIYVDGECYWNGVDVWLVQGEHILNAFPFPGYVFAGWSVNGALSTASLRTINVTAPMIVGARFEPAKRVHFQTSPPGLKVLVDRQPILAPDTPTGGGNCGDPVVLTPPFPPTALAACFDWALNSKHVLGAPSPQTDKYGKVWVFSRWSNGGGQNMLYTVSDLNTTETLTAEFTPGASVSFLTNPVALKLKVEGRDNWPSYNFVWAVGYKFQVTAPAEQTDSRGRRYVFKSWSNDGPATQEITVPESAVSEGYRLIATYELLSRITVQSAPPGLTMQVDAAECKTPCTLDRKSGETARVSATLAVPVSELSRLEFEGWSDGGTAERTLSFADEPRTLTANYRTAHLVRISVEPGDGARVRCDPNSSDGFYAANTAVMMNAQAYPGYRFRRWEGDLTGTYPSAMVTVGAPRLVRVILDRSPYIAPAGIRNAAGETPEASVAAGSLISIHGASLSDNYEVGPASPLAQTLGNVTVRLRDRLLALLFVSPGQINAQLPSDLEEGEHTLGVRWGTHPEVTASFTLSRNAPGLFSRIVDDRAFAIALHEDGSPVTLDSPARRGEPIQLLGTGFGPYDRPVPDGFAVPVEPAYRLLDAVDVLAGDLRIEPSWTGAAAGHVGVSLVRLRIPDGLATGSVPLRLIINQRSSNTVLLPVAE